MMNEFCTCLLELHVVGLAEIAEQYGVRPSAISNWQNRYDDWPHPRLILKMGPLYCPNEVQEFINNHPGLLNPNVIEGHKGAKK